MSKALSFCLLVFAFSCTSSRATPSEASSILLTITVSPELTDTGTSNVLYPKKSKTKT